MNHIQAMTAYVEAGLSIVPVSIKSKYPTMLPGWRAYMQRLPTAQEIGLWATYRNSNEYGIGVITGAVSGNLEVVDFDNALFNAAQVFEQYTNIPEVSEIINRYQLPIEETQSGGFHVFYKAENVEGSQKLADLISTDFDRARVKDGKYWYKEDKGLPIKTNDGVEYILANVIETRGEGGLIVFAPTKGYNVIAGDLLNIPTITPEERNILISYARSFNMPDFEEPEKPFQAKQINKDELRPGDYYNENCADEIPALLTKHGWTHTYKNNWRRPGKKYGVSATVGYVGPGCLYTWSPNAGVELKKKITPFKLLVDFEFNGDWTAAARAVAERFPDVFEHKKKQYATTPIQSSQPAPPSLGIKSVDENPDFDDFWYLTEKGAIKIHYLKLKKFLTKSGFYRFRTGGKYFFVRVTKNIVDFCTFEEIQNFILRSVISDPERENIFDLLIDSGKLSEKNLQILDECDPIFLRDPEDSSFVFFKNKAVHVTALGKQSMSYAELPGFIWKKQIIDRDYNDLIEDVFDYCDFANFLRRISADKVDRMAAAMGAIGYMLHTYKDPAFCPVIFVTDDSGDDGPNGGSGKGTIAQAISRIRNNVFLDGKSFDPKNSFALQRVGEDTDVVTIDDMDKRFDFESLFSMITDGMTVSKKYRDEMFIAFSNSPKIMVTSNYQVRGDSESFDRRIFDIEVHKFFNRTDRSLVKVFGRRFFEFGWDKEEWNKFDNFMIYCIQYYLRNGLIKPEYVHVAINKLIANTSRSFVEWASGALKCGHVFPKKLDLFMRYKEETCDDVLKQKYFTQNLAKYAEYKGWKINTRAGMGGMGVSFSSDGEPEPEAVDQGGALPF